MSEGELITLLREGVQLVLYLASPLLISALIIGLIVAILQATTSIQEQTLVFVPKLFTILIVVAILGGWMFSTLRQYTMNLFMQIPGLAR